MDSTCSGDGVKITGNNETVPGGITSNGTFLYSGNSNTSLGGTSFGGPSTTPLCTSTPGSATYTPAGQTRVTSVTPWPIDYSTAALKPPCNFSAASYTMATGNAPGVYCATGQIIIPAGTTLSGITMIAAGFDVSGNNISDTPASNANGLSIYQTGSTLLNFSGNGVTAQSIFAPTAEVELSGDSAGNILGGFIEAYDVWINGNNHQINGTGPPSSSTAGALQG
jgi:hypothetical protein